jgi:tetratricopeptide (TPR) repeat protein
MRSMSKAGVAALVLAAAAGFTSHAAEARAWCSPVHQTREAAAEAVITCTEELAQPGLTNEKRAALLRNRAMMHSKIREYQKAIEDCTESLRLNPGDMWTMNVRGAAEVRTGRWEDARRDYSASLKEDPHDLAALLGRAEVYLALGEIGRAEADVNEALRRLPESPVAPVPALTVLPKRAEIQAAEGKFAKAVAIIDELVSKFGDLRFARCELFARWGQELDRALEDCNEVARRNPSGGDARRAIVYYRQGRYAEAIADCTKHLGVDPRNPMALYVRGLARIRAGDRTGGEADVAAAKAVAAGDVESFERDGLKP